MLEVIQIPVLFDNYQYLVVCGVSREAIVVDAPDAEAMIREIEKRRVKLTAIWNTHHHADHVAGNAEMAERYRVPVFCGAHDFEKMRIPAATRALREGETVRVGNCEFRVWEIPGHTLGHIAYEGHDSLFCGDTLFAGGCGRLFEGNPLMMKSSLDKIASFPEQTKIYCAHEYTQRNLEFALTLEPENEILQKKYREVLLLRENDSSTVPTTLEEEKSYNPFLRAEKSREILDNLKRKGYTGLENPVAAFAAVRELKDQF